MDFYVACALGLGDGVEFRDILGAPVTESHGPWIIGKDELDLEFTSVPACLRGVIVWVYHRTRLQSNFGRVVCSSILACICLHTLIMDRASIPYTAEYQLFMSHICGNHVVLLHMGNAEYIR